MTSYQLDKFDDHRNCDGRDILKLCCQVILQDMRSKGHVILWAGAHQCKLPFCQVWWHCGREDIKKISLSRDLTR